MCSLFSQDLGKPGMLSQELAFGCLSLYSCYEGTGSPSLQRLVLHGPHRSSEVGFSSVARTRVKLNEGFIQGGGVPSEHQPSLACGREVQELSEARCLRQQRDCSEVSLWLRTLLLRKFVEFTRCDSRTGLRWRLQLST